RLAERRPGRTSPRREAAARRETAPLGRTSQRSRFSHGASAGLCKTRTAPPAGQLVVAFDVMYVRRVALLRWLWQLCNKFGASGCATPLGTPGRWHGQGSGGGRAPPPVAGARSHPSLCSARSRARRPAPATTA